LDDNAVIQKSSFSAQGQGSFRAYFCMDDSQTVAYNFTWGPLAPTDDTAPDPTSGHLSAGAAPGQRSTRALRALVPEQ
jgi:hypothetical protein